MSEPIRLLADLPMGDGPKRQHRRMREGLRHIANRVALSALANRSHSDVFMEVYCAGIAHAHSLIVKKDTGHE